MEKDGKKVRQTKTIKVSGGGARSGDGIRLKTAGPNVLKGIEDDKIRTGKIHHIIE